MQEKIVGCKDCEYRITRFIRSGRAWIQGGYHESRCIKSKKDKRGEHLKVWYESKKPHRECPLLKEKEAKRKEN